MTSATSPAAATVGELPAAPVHSFLTRTVLKTLVVHTRFSPPRGKVQTAPEMLTSLPGSWEADLSACMALMDRVAEGEAAAVHPMFGPLSPEEWGKLCWKHLDHHLVQFGV